MKVKVVIQVSIRIRVRRVRGVALPSVWVGPTLTLTL